MENQGQVDLKTLTTPSLIWQRHASAYAVQKSREEVSRSDAYFDDVTPEVCGERIRIMTPVDILVLDRLKNPLICGGTLSEITGIHVKQFLWALNVEHRPGLFSELRRCKFIKRIDTRLGDSHERLLLMVNAVVEYIETVFQDFPTRKTEVDKIAESEGNRRPIGAHMLARILVPLATQVGAFDPFDGRPWQYVPLPRIFQYIKVSSANGESGSTDDSPHRMIEAQWLKEVNEARIAGILVGEGDIPGSRELDGLSASEIIAAHVS